MKLTRRVATMTGSALLSAGVLTGLSAAPASAQPHVIRPAVSHGCPNGDLCLYQNKSWNANGGSQWSFSYNSVRPDNWIYVGDAANDQATSFVNNRVLSSAISENKIDAFPNNCADIVGNGGNQASTESVADLSGFFWVDGNKMNDSVSAFMLKSSNYNLCDTNFIG